MRPISRACILVATVALLLAPTAHAGCCMTTAQGNGVYNPNIDDSRACARLNGEITDLNTCAAKAHRRLKVMPKDS